MEVKGKTMFGVVWILVVYVLGVFFFTMQAISDSLDRWKGAGGWAVAAWAFVAGVALLVPAAFVWVAFPDDNWTGR